MCAYCALELSNQNFFFFEKSHRSVRCFDQSEQRQRDNICHIDAHTERRKSDFESSDLDCLPNASSSRHNLRRNDTATPIAHQTNKCLRHDMTSLRHSAPRKPFFFFFFFFFFFLFRHLRLCRGGSSDSFECKCRALRTLTLCDCCRSAVEFAVAAKSKKEKTKNRKGGLVSLLDCFRVFFVDQFRFSLGQKRTSRKLAASAKEKNPSISEQRYFSRFFRDDLRSLLQHCSMPSVSAPRSPRRKEHCFVFFFFFFFLFFFCFFFFFFCYNVCYFWLPFSFFGK
jgi:hypothetical protein